MSREDGATAPAAEGGEVFYEDLQVGRRFTSGSRPLDADAVKAFARDFDPQPFHTDEETARGTFFDGLAASGWHTAALTMRLLVESRCRLPQGSSVPASNSSGRNRRGPATC